MLAARLPEVPICVQTQEQVPEGSPAKPPLADADAEAEVHTPSATSAMPATVLGTPHPPPG